MYKIRCVIRPSEDQQTTTNPGSSFFPEQGSFTSLSDHPMAAANTWNAFHALRLFPKEDNFHCMGSAKSTIDGCCMRPTNRANRQAAHNTLRDMSMVDPMSRDARELLHLLVPKILCLQNHQHQAGELYKELRARMRKARDGIAYRPTIVVARGWEPRRGIKSQALGAPVQPSWIVARRAEAEAALAEDSESDSEEEDDEAPLGTGHPPGAWPEEPNEEPVVESEEPALVAAPEMGQVDNPMRDRHQRLAANAPHEVCRVRHVRRRPLEPDCAICTLPMNMEDGVVWCKAECGQNLHRECMREWEDQREERGQLLCPFCRVPWAAPCEHDEQEPPAADA